MSLGVGLPMHTMSLGGEVGPWPSLFLKAIAASYRTPGCRPCTSASRAGAGTGSGSFCTTCHVVESTNCHVREPNGRNFTVMPVSGGTTVMVCHLTRMWHWCWSTTKSRGSFGQSGRPGCFTSPIQAGLLTGDSLHQRPLMRKATIASYSMPSSMPLATVSDAGAAMAVPPQRYQLWSPRRRSFTIVDLASSGKTHFTRILPWPNASRVGTSGFALLCSTNSMPLVVALASATAAESLGMEYSPKPSALRQQTAATYSTPSSIPVMVVSRRMAPKVVLPEETSFPLAASTNIFLPLPTSVTCTCDASTGGHARGMAQVHFSLPGPRATSFGGAGWGGFSLGFSSPMCSGKLGAEMSPQPSLFITATMAS
mmetsp:Transcript_57579/g.184878  ORF Transcript_57579/g.184878 Transcript_57579/m.184878 type:complete len:369 (+) Transcript_57579:1177-2283(+)